jgi:hypothetical protein
LPTIPFRAPDRGIERLVGNKAQEVYDVVLASLQSFHETSPSCRLAVKQGY